MRQITTVLRETFNHGGATRERLVHWNEPPYLLARYGLEALGSVENGDGFEIVRLDPPLTILQYISEGRGEVWIDQDWVEAPAGMAYLMPPGVPHGYRSIPGVRCRRQWVIVRDALKLDLAQPSLRKVQGQPFQHAIEGALEEREFENSPERMAIWLDLLVAYARQIAGVNGNRPARLQTLWRAVSREPAFAWDLQELAALACLSEESVRRITKDETGMTPMQKVTEIRMKTAASMLRTYQHSIDQIADQIGYSSAFSFSAAFKRWSGVAPSVYRQGEGK